MENNVIKKRNTKQRKIVYDTVMKHCDHPTAEDIYVDIHEKYKKLSKATVYRNLNALSESGEITHVKVPGADRFDSKLENHYHVICTVCGKVVDSPFDYCFDDDFVVEKETGFKISRHRTVFEGICPECMKKEQGKNK